MSTIVIAVIDACGQTPGHSPHLRGRTRPRLDSQPHETASLWCPGQYERERQNRRVVIRREDGTDTLVGEGLTIVGSALREPREPGECGECRLPEDFGWDMTRWEDDAPVIVCHRHASLAPGWAYDDDVEVAEDAWKNARPALTAPEPPT